VTSWFSIFVFSNASTCTATYRGQAFELSAPSTRRNTARLLRAMQLAKPILLEGSPGVGKTSLVAALAKAAGHKLVRINLSEQTDMMDLLVGAV
jgi:midasin